MAKAKKESIILNDTDVINMEVVPTIEADGSFVKESAHSIEVNKHVVSAPIAEVEKIMPTVIVQGKKVFPTDYKFVVGDEVEIHGIPECKEYHMFGKIFKQLDDYTYAVHGHSFLLNQKAIGHNGILARSFKEANLRKVTIVNAI